jgi:hypothetical protein
MQKQPCGTNILVGLSCACSPMQRAHHQQSMQSHPFPQCKAARACKASTSNAAHVYSMHARLLYKPCTQLKRDVVAKYVNPAQTGASTRFSYDASYHQFLRRLLAQPWAIPTVGTTQCTRLAASPLRSAVHTEQQTIADQLGTSRKA